MSAFGLLPFGTGSPWGGAGQVSIITMAVSGTNQVQVFFAGVPRWNDPLGYQDSRNALLWGIEPVDPVNIGLSGEVVVTPGRRRPSYTVWIGEVFQDADDPTQLTLRTVPQLEPGILYDVSLLGPIRGANCEDFGGLATFRVAARNRSTAVKQSLQFAAQSTYQDYANPFFTVDPRTGQPALGPGFWIYDEAGELVFDDAAESLRKRVFRRIQTEIGGFVHLGNYGTANIKGQIGRPGALQRFALSLQEQLRSEPDVRDASVSAAIEQTPQGGIAIFVVKVQARSVGEVSFRVQVPAVGV